MVGYRGPFDGFHCVPTSVSKTCTVRLDNNRYSVLSTAVGRPVEIQSYADRIVIRQDGITDGEHARSFGRAQTAYNPWHFIPLLARKPCSCAMARRSSTGIAAGAGASAASVERLRRW